MLLFVYIAHQLVAVMLYPSDISPVKVFISLYISPHVASRLEINVEGSSLLKLLRNVEINYHVC